jgi:plasmid maintenance system antidote protein VapI
MPNDRLRDALMTAWVTHEELAADLGVHTKTVERWITQDRTPYPQFRHRISVLVQKD